MYVKSKFEQVTWKPIWFVFCEENVLRIVQLLVCCKMQMEMLLIHQRGRKVKGWLELHRWRFTALHGQFAGHHLIAISTFRWVTRCLILHVAICDRFCSHFCLVIQTMHPAAERKQSLICALGPSVSATVCRNCRNYGVTAYC